MKKQYEPAKLEIIIFDVCDVIRTSNPPVDNNNNGGSGIGGGYNPGGWTRANLSISQIKKRKDKKRK